MENTDAKELEFRKSLLSIWEFALDGTKRKEKHITFQSAIEPNDKRLSADYKKMLHKTVGLVVDEMSCALESNGFDVEHFVVNLLKGVGDIVFEGSQYPKNDLKLQITFTWETLIKGKNEVSVEWAITHDNTKTTYPKFWFAK